MSKPTDAATPTIPLGRDFTKLWSASVASNLADGLGRTAVPLLATTLTTDPVLISAITALAFVPWLLFGVFAGVIVDRVDRRWAMAAANSLRVIAAIVIALSISTGTMTIWLLYACVLVFGIAETVFDNASIAIMPSIVKRANFERANSRMQAADLVVQNFIATPIAGLLFAVAIVLPVWSTAAGFFVAAALALTLPLAAGRAKGSERTEPSGAGADIKEAALFLWHSRFLRNLIITAALVGAFLSIAQATAILFILETLEVPIAAVGFVTAGVGVGATIGALVASPLVKRFGRGKVMFWATLSCGIFTALTGLSPNVWTGVIVFGIAAGSVSVWNVPYGSLRQEIIPGRLLGRCIGITRTLTWGSFPVASIIGGFVGRVDLRLPFFVGGALMIVTVLFAAKLLLSAGDQMPAEEESQPSAVPGHEPGEVGA